jgi:hypothetical protein
LTNSQIHNLRELAKTCSTRMEFARLFNPEYQRIMRAGLADELFKHMPRPKRWTRPELERIATKYESRSEWLADSPHTFQAAHRLGIVDDICPPSRRGKHLHEAAQ